MRAWLILPKDHGGGCVVTYAGYGNGRGLPHQHLRWAAAGWATFVMDSRGQGAGGTQAPGGTGDPHGPDHAHAPGMMTKGILSEHTYYYRGCSPTPFAPSTLSSNTRRSTRPASLSPEAAREAASPRPSRGFAATCGGAFIDVPFLTDFSRALDVATTGPYPEIVKFLAGQRHAADRALQTLSYFDGMHFAARATTTARYSVALRDTTCPPSTVFAGYNHWGGPKDIDVWPWNGHEGGLEVQAQSQLVDVSRW